MAKLVASGDAEAERVLLIKFIFFEIQAITIFSDILSDKQIQEITENRVFFADGVLSGEGFSSLHKRIGYELLRQRDVFAFDIASKAETALLLISQNEPTGQLILADVIMDDEYNWPTQIARLTSLRSKKSPIISDIVQDQISNEIPTKKRVMIDCPSCKTGSIVEGVAGANIVPCPSCGIRLKVTIS